MKTLPHQYKVVATGAVSGNVSLSAENTPDLATSAPPEFGGPGEMWSPETMLSGSVASCFILTFRALARAASFAYADLRCEVDGKLDRVSGGLEFVSFEVRARLTVPAGADAEQAQTLLTRAERGCLISRSLRGAITLETEIRHEDAAG